VIDYVEAWKGNSAACADITKRMLKASDTNQDIAEDRIKSCDNIVCIRGLVTEDDKIIGDRDLDFFSSGSKAHPSSMRHYLSANTNITTSTVRFHTVAPEI